MVRIQTPFFLSQTTEKARKALQEGLKWLKYSVCILQLCRQSQDWQHWGPAICNCGFCLFSGTASPLDQPRLLVPPPAVASPQLRALHNTVDQEQDQDKIIKPQVPQKNTSVLHGAEKGIQHLCEIVLLHCLTNSFSSP